MNVLISESKLNKGKMIATRLRVVVIQMRVVEILLAVFLVFVQKDILVQELSVLVTPTFLKKNLMILFYFILF